MEEKYDLVTKICERKYHNIYNDNDFDFRKEYWNCR